MSLRENYSNETEYHQWQDQKLEEWEELCVSCGACCGIVEGDPCEHLVQRSDSRYVCDIYETRFGSHKTKSGRPFQCVPIRDVLHKSWAGDQNCGYKRKNIQ